jgi:hypothetical protein
MQRLPADFRIGQMTIVKSLTACQLSDIVDFLTFCQLSERAWQCAVNSFV